MIDMNEKRVYRVMLGRKKGKERIYFEIQGAKKYIKPILIKLLFYLIPIAVDKAIFICYPGYLQQLANDLTSPPAVTLSSFV